MNVFARVGVLDSGWFECWLSVSVCECRVGGISRKAGASNHHHQAICTLQTKYEHIPHVWKL